MVKEEKYLSERKTVLLSAKRSFPNWPPYFPESYGIIGIDVHTSPHVERVLFESKKLSACRGEKRRVLRWR
jgi:hypothetical protein